jgi:CheY-like chemotaxis protein
VTGKLAFRVLVVDDEPLDRRFLSTILVSAGYIVRTAVDGIDGIGKLRGTPIDLIISDLQMPRMSGQEFLAIVRQRLPQIPVIAFGGEIASGGIPAGVPADLYFQKGATEFGDILQSVSQLIRNPPPRSISSYPDTDLKWPTWDSEGHFSLTCGDCLRTFKVLDGGKSWRGRFASTCPSCGSVVWFSASSVATH